MAKVTIEDISRQTGLSRGTVSRALNDRPDISQQTKLRVLEACRELNYVPSQAARSLATGRNYAAGIVVDDLEATGSAGLMRGVLEAAEAANYSICVAELGSDPEQRRVRLNRMLRERIDAVLLAATPDDVVRKTLKEALAGQPVASYSVLDGFDCDVFTPDYAEAGRLAARHLLNRAGREIAYVWRPGVAGAEASVRGFQEVVAGESLDPEAATIAVDVATSALEQQLLPRLSQLRGVAAMNDALAVQVMLLSQRNGRVVGGDLAVMGQGNEPLGRQIAPALTTMDLGSLEAGRRAMEMLLQRVNRDRMDASAVVRIAPELLERASTRLA